MNRNNERANCPWCGCNGKREVSMTDEEFSRLQQRVSDLEKYTYKKSNEQKCLWDSMPETQPGSGMKIAGLSCPCPKCSPSSQQGVTQ